MEAFQSYLLSEKLLVLSAGLIGVASLVLGLVFLFALPQFKAFALTMLTLGAIEAVVFMSTYAKSESTIQAKIEAYTTDPAVQNAEQLVLSTKALKSFFWLKLLYASVIVVLSFAISRLGTGSIWIGIFTALIIHLAAGITIDNFGERYTKNYRRALVQQVE